MDSVYKVEGVVRWDVYIEFVFCELFVDGYVMWGRINFYFEVWV